MIDHLVFHVRDFDKARAFYDAVLVTLGYRRNANLVGGGEPNRQERRRCAYGPDDRYCFWLIESDELSTPRHVAFVAKSRTAVDAFYRAAIATGAQSNGAPGLRPVYHANYYGAFVFDPDGNNIEAVSHGR
ncbi:MAG: VOC family protein [Polyangiales bacterium]